jgi:hypothetical protein
MASPDIFPSVHVGLGRDEKEFVAHFTNPIKSILDEAGKVFEDTAKVACILSLGSGTKLVQGIPVNPKPTNRIKLLVDIAEDCETAHQEAASRYGELGIYHRINIESDSFSTGISEWEEDFTHIHRATRSYLEANVRRLDRVVDRFVRSIGGPTIRDLS